MEPDVSMETGRTIRVAVIPVGGPIPAPILRDYVSMLSQHTRVDLSTIGPFYTEHQKSPFAHQPWDSGSLRLRYLLGGSPPSPWEDFQSNRKVLAVLGLCHCPSSPDLKLVLEQFKLSCKAYASALAVRCFAFCPTDSQLEYGQNNGNTLILFPPSDRKSQELHMLTMVQDLAASLLMEFEKRVLGAGAGTGTESTGTILKTPLDSQASHTSEEVIKTKKKMLGRAQKTIGDYCLLAGSPLDANAHYATAIELARLTGDVFWHAGALEGSACALVVDREDHKDPAVEEEVKYRYFTVIQLYRRLYLQDNSQRVSTVNFELEAALKLARYLCRRENPKDVVDLLMGAADGAKFLIDANDRLILYIEIARLFGSLGYQRKAAFFSRQVAQLYLQQDSSWAAISAMKVLSMTSKAYHVQSKGAGAGPPISTNESGLIHADGKMHLQSIVSMFESQWSTLQMVVLREILLSSVRAGDPLAAWSAAARLLRSYYPLITPAGQSGLASSLSNSAERLPSGIRCADPALPFIRLHSFPMFSSQMDIIKRNPSKPGWWRGSAPTGPFIYTPFSKGGPNEKATQELTWIIGEPVQVLVELANPCGFDLVVDSIYLSVHSGNFDAFPVSVNLPPNTAKVVPLSGIPTKSGPVSIPGCIVHCFGVITEHLFKDVDNLLLGAAQGLVLSDPFRCCGSGKLKNVSIPNISIVQPLPLLVSHVVGGDGASILYEGEIRDVCVSLTNAGSVPVEQAHISLLGKNQDSVISIADKALKLALPLKPGAGVLLPVTIKAWQLGIADYDPASGKNALGTGRMAREGSGPLLVIHYAGPLDCPDTLLKDEIAAPLGRRLVVPLQVCVTHGLRFVKARILSMDIPALVTEKLPKPVSLEDNLNDIDYGNRADSLVKMDPYRGSWGLRLLELELSNPTDVSFEVSVTVQMEKSESVCDSAELCCPKTRIDRDYSARVLIPLGHFKLPVLDGSFFAKETWTYDAQGTKTLNASGKSSKAELSMLINNLISRIKVKWQSGRNSSGELNIKDAIQAALQTSVMDVLLPDPLTFGFRLPNNCTEAEKPDSQPETNTQLNISDDLPVAAENWSNTKSKGSILTHEITPMEILVRNNTRETIKMSLSISCRDIAGDNCIEGKNATVLWAGVLSGVSLEVLPLQEVTHSFSLYFMVPGEYTLQGAAVIEDATDILRARARTTSPEEPIFCRGSPFHVCVVGLGWLSS